MSIALVTGAGSGIGLEVCRQLAQKDCTVLLTARDLAKAETAAAQLANDKLTVLPRALDVSNDASVHALAESVAAEFGQLDILVNNAAAWVGGPDMPLSADLAVAHNTFETNLFGAWRTIQIFEPLLRKSSHPRVVNVSSGGGSHGDPQFGLITNHGASVSYGVSKAALNALTAKLAAELEGSGILINAICPGFTATAPGMAAMGARPIPEGAAGIVWAALLPDDGPSGGFFRDGKPLAW